MSVDANFKSEEGGGEEIHGGFGGGGVNRC